MPLDQLFPIVYRGLRDVSKLMIYMLVPYILWQQTYNMVEQQNCEARVRLQRSAAEDDMADMAKVDGVFRTRSLGVSAIGIPDQYSDGKAAQVWTLYVGNTTRRTDQYKQWLLTNLRDRGTKNVLDVACGTGIDSVMLVEEGFSMWSCDASDKMLKYALKERWNRRKDPGFDDWVIEEANWLTLEEDFKDIPHPQEKFDAVICLGNSFPHLPDFDGEQKGHRQALQQFWKMVKPGGVLMIDHRNYDAILEKGVVPVKNVYYNSEHIEDIKCSNLFVNGEPRMVTLDYAMNVTGVKGISGETDQGTGQAISTFRLSYYPHRLTRFVELMKETIGDGATHKVLADFKPLTEASEPAYYIHVIEKKA